MPANCEKEIFEQALDLPSAGERMAFLQRACGGDAAMLERLQQLLRVEEKAEGFLRPEPGRAGTPAGTIQLGTTCLAPVTEKPGDKIDRYKLLQKIGEGGMGVVYMAEQEEPVRRQVAFKIIKLGMDTRSVVARFEAERQALAMMDHPNIARVLDAGATETGRPYFVMELVRGVPITVYCDKNHLDTEARLGLFIQVCHAIQHAHQKGVIHRDIKPSNVMVTLHDGVPVPKVIDFGIAKATGQRLTEKTLFTNYATMIGTPAYMSPEQAEMSGLDIDTRTDVYALGVLLYELLTGTTPFPAAELLSKSYGEMQRIIAEVEPMRPSTRLSTMQNEERTVVAKNRGTEESALSKGFKGDLDWIVMKCLEKDRTRRYETANGLAADLKRHLSNEPVVARPPSTAYRFQKLVRRNKLAFAAAAAVVFTLFLGLLAASWQAVRATKAELAERKQAAQARSDRDRAMRAEADASEKALLAVSAQNTTRRNLYASDINVALQALGENNLGRAVELLDRQRPKPGEEDLRGFEWRHLWSLCQSDAVRTFPDGGAYGIAFSPDGRHLVSGGSSAAVVRDTVSWRVVTNFPSASTVSFSPSTGTAALGRDKTVTLVEPGSWTERVVQPAAFPAVYSADGRWLVTRDGNHFQLRDAKSLQILGTCFSQIGLAWHSRNLMAVSPDGRFLVTPHMFGGEFKVWQLPALVEAPGFKEPAVEAGSAAFSTDGKFLFIGGWDGNLSVWDVAMVQHIQTAREHTAWITAIAVARDGKTFATASSDRTIVVWDATTRKPIVRLRGHLGEVWSLAYSPDGALLASGGSDRVVRLWNASTRRPETTLEGAYLPVGFSADGQTLIVAGGDFAGNDFARVWNPDQGKTDDLPLRPDPLVNPVTPHLLALAPNQRQLAIGRTNGTVELWDLTTRTRTAAWPAHTGDVTAFAFSPDSQRLATGGADHTATIWRLSDQRRLVSVPTGSQSVSCVAFSPDGRWLATSGSSTPRLWDAATGEKAAELDGHRNAIWTIAFSPDGKLLASASLDNEVRLWEVPSGKLHGVLKGHVQGASSLAFSPDGKTLATGAHDRRVKLWHVATQQEMATLPVGQMVWRLCFSPDGRRLAVGSESGGRSAIHLWRAPSFEEIAAAEKARNDGTPQ